MSYFECVECRELIYHVDDPDAVYDSSDGDGFEICDYYMCSSCAYIIKNENYHRALQDEQINQVEDVFPDRKDEKKKGEN